MFLFCLVFIGIEWFLSKKTKYYSYNDLCETISYVVYYTIKCDSVVILTIC